MTLPPPPSSSLPADPAEEETIPWPHSQPVLDRLLYECRYSALARNTRVRALAYTKGFNAGLWGRSRRRCPVRKPGGLYYAWMDGYAHGWNKRSEMLEAEPPPRPGPRGGRRIAA